MEKWEIHKVSDLWLSADEAVACGLSDETADFAPPTGEPLVLLRAAGVSGAGNRSKPGKNGGRDRDRTCDPFHVKEVLYR
jgi:hypothetical protein